jgi:PAS domain S-box-containing protein
VWIGFWLGVEEINQRHRRLGIEESVIALIRLDGAVVAFTTNRGKMPDRAALERIRTDPLFDRMRKGPLPALLEGVSAVDAVPKLFAVSRIDDTAIPLMVTVSRDMDSIVADWHRSATAILWMAIGASVVLLTLTALVSRFMLEINRRETQFQQLFDSSLASILMIKNGRVAACNQMATKVFRTSEECTLKGLALSQFSPAHQPDGTKSEDALAHHSERLREHPATAFRWVFKRLDGSPFEADVCLSRIQVADDTITLAIVHDISELERARRELQEANVNLEQRVAQRTRELQDANARLAAANRELEQFSASVSHDLRSPLTSISAQANMLELELGEALGARGKERVGKIGAGVRRAADIIEGLLSLARIARQELVEQRVSLSKVAEEVMAELRESEPARQVMCRIEPEMWVNADPRLMHSLLQNLLGNAWKYSSDQPQPFIEVSRRLEGNEVVYRVSDNGIGFDMAHADRIFQAFERLAHGRAFTGVGLGLAIVARIVARYGGRVWAQGKEGVGASFDFTLPQAEEVER